MKKVVRILGLCALMALAFTSCKKEKETSELTFKATITQPVSDTKTHLDGLNLVWNEGNSIKVFNANGAVGTFTTTDADVQEASFSGTLPQTATYTAFYPVAEDMVNGNAVTLNVPASQNYVANDFGNDTYPMAAAGTISNDIVHFPFHSPASVIRLVLTSDNNCTVGNISMIGPDDNNKFSGNIVYANYNNIENYTFQNTFNGVELNCGNGVQLLAETPTAFNLVVLSGTMPAGTTFQVKDTNNNVIKSLTTNVENILAAEHILVMPTMEISYANPDVHTDAVSNLTSTSATLNGHYSCPAGVTATACGFLWGTSHNNVAGGMGTEVTAALGSPVAYNLTGLTGNTYYSYRTWVRTATNTYYGEVVDFQTPVQVSNPQVQTTGVDLTGTSATFKGKIVNDGNEACHAGFRYGTDPNLNTYSTVNASGTYNTGANFNKNKGGFNYNVTYYYRAFAYNSANGSSNPALGEILSFKIEYQGNFKINDNDDRVTFAPGLLWWDNNAQQFAVENDQFSYHLLLNNTNNEMCDISEANASYGQFCWSHPYDDFGRNRNENPDGDFVDWGTLSIRKPNSNEMYAPNTFRTLSFDEWQYIIGHHNWEVLDGKFVVMPYDPYDLFGMPSDYTTGGHYDWQALNDLGALILPCAGGAARWIFDDNYLVNAWEEGRQLNLWTSTMARHNDGSPDRGSAGVVWFYLENGGYINGSIFFR